MVPEGCIERSQVERRSRSACSNLHLHNGTGIRSVAGQDGRGADRAEVWCACVIVSSIGRERRGGIIVQNQGLTGELLEVDDDVGSISRSEQQ
jgi:hypothetical protein